MPWDIAVELENRPGTIAELGEAAANAGINLDGICGFPSEGIGVIHVLVDDPAAARDAFTEAASPSEPNVRCSSSASPTGPGSLVN